MHMTEFLDTWYFDYLILPLLIFLARIIDVSMDTIRMIFIARGFKKFAPLIGFFQVLVWIITITRIMANLDNWTCYIAYAAGFAAGNLTGAACSWDRINPCCYKETSRSADNCA